ncbi:MAG: hypothetical protein R2722_05280 [Tessaracoccus sp.]
MENDAAAAREALDAVNAAKHLNARRLRRPWGYWVLFGAFLSAFVLLPYVTDRLPVLQFILPPMIAIVIAVVAARIQPVAVRKLRLSVRMVLQVIGFALLAGVVGGLGGAAYVEYGWWWMPLIAAVLVFAVVVVLGPLLDRSWMRQVSQVG